MKTKNKATSRFIAEPEDGVAHSSGRPITPADEAYADDVWATITGKAKAKK
jgi:hypothetical protein